MHITKGEALYLCTFAHALVNNLDLAGKTMLFA